MMLQCEEVSTQSLYVAKTRTPATQPVSSLLSRHAGVSKPPRPLDLRTGSGYARVGRGYHLTSWKGCVKPISLSFRLTFLSVSKIMWQENGVKGFLLH